jgi:hypothetical protein
MFKTRSPYILTGLHASASWLGCTVVMLFKGVMFRIPTLSLIDYFKIVLFSLLYTVNIGISNVSLSVLVLVIIL